MRGDSASETLEGERELGMLGADSPTEAMEGERELGVMGADSLAEVMERERELGVDSPMPMEEASSATGVGLEGTEG